MFAMSCRHYAMAVRLRVARERCRSPHGRVRCAIRVLISRLRGYFWRRLPTRHVPIRACFMMRRGDSNCDSGRPLQGVLWRAMPGPHMASDVRGAESGHLRNVNFRVAEALVTRVLTGARFIVG